MARARSRNSFIRRSMSSARSPTLCSRCSSANVASIWRVAMTLAVLVIMITASTSRKPPNVSWPIESENDRILWKTLAKGMGIRTGSEQTLYIPRIEPKGEQTRNIATTAVQAGSRRPSNNLGATHVKVDYIKNSAFPGSIRGDTGVLDDLRPQRDVGLDDVGKLRKRRARPLAPGGVRLLLGAPPL